MSWKGPAPTEAVDEDWPAQVLAIDAEDGTRDDPEGAYDLWKWDGSALDRAARAYRRECRWDFAPGEAGLWFVAAAPWSWVGGEDGDGQCGGNLVGFAILHDRDNDGDYSLAHLWTAQGWRRRGIASILLAKADAAYSIKRVEWPVTKSGRALLAHVRPDLLQEEAQ